MESCPAKGGAKYVESHSIIQELKNADLTEAEAVLLHSNIWAITPSGWAVPISEVSYGEKIDNWTVEFAPEQEDQIKIEIKDNKS